MKRLIAIPLCLLLLVGCSKTITSTGTSIEINGKVAEVEEHCGTSAISHLGELPVEFELLPGGWADSRHNPNDLDEEDMFEYNKAKYILNYNATQLVAQLETKDGSIEAFYASDGFINGENTMVQIYPMLESSGLALYKRASFKDIVFLNVEGLDFKVRPHEIVVPQLIRISADIGNVACTESVEIGKVTVNKGTKGGFDFYSYNGVLVQAVSGYDISKVITFK